MNSLKLKGTWNEISGKLKQEYAMLTDDDLLFVKGKEEELLGRLQIKLGKTKEELKNIISGVSKSALDLLYTPDSKSRSLY